MFETLGIQWPKLIAQFVNFAIVLFVLWRFAYKPVFQLLEARRQKIADGIANAEKIKAELAATEVERRRSRPPRVRRQDRGVRHGERHR